MHRVLARCAKEAMSCIGSWRAALSVIEPDLPCITVRCAAPSERGSNVACIGLWRRAPSKKGPVLCAVPVEHQYTRRSRRALARSALDARIRCWGHHDPHAALEEQGPLLRGSHALRVGVCHETPFGRRKKRKQIADCVHSDCVGALRRQSRDFMMCSMEFGTHRIKDSMVGASVPGVQRH